MLKGEKCPEGCPCKRHQRPKGTGLCRPGCKCARHGCRPGCKCGRHDRPGRFKKCAPDCLCGRHRRSKKGK